MASISSSDEASTRMSSSSSDWVGWSRESSFDSFMLRSRSAGRPQGRRSGFSFPMTASIPLFRVHQVAVAMPLALGAAHHRRPGTTDSEPLSSRHRSRSAYMLLV